MAVLAVALAVLAVAAPVAAASPDSLVAAAYPYRLEAVDTLGRPEDGAHVAGPGGIATDAFGRIYVSDEREHRVLRFGDTGELLDQAGSLGSGAGQMRSPAGVARLGSLGVAVLDRENQRVVSWNLRLEWLGVVAAFGSESEAGATIGTVQPVALAADRGGAVYVADADADRVLVFDFSGRYVNALGGHGSAPGRFAGLAAVAALPRGALAVVDRPEPAAPARVQWLDAGGRPLGDARPLFAAPPRKAWGRRLAAAADDSAHVAVADEGAGSVEVFGADHTPLARLDGLAGPAALAFAPDGTLLVAEAGAARVRRFRLVPAAPER